MKRSDLVISYDGQIAVRVETIIAKDRTIPVFYVNGDGVFSATVEDVSLRSARVEDLREAIARMVD